MKHAEVPAERSVGRCDHGHLPTVKAKEENLMQASVAG